MVVRAVTAVRFEVGVDAMLSAAPSGRRGFLAPGRTVDVTDPDGWRLVCGEGWSEPDAHGPWSIAPTARLRLSAPALPADAVIDLRVVAFTPEGHDQRVEAWVAGRRVGDVRLTHCGWRPERLIIPVPRDVGRDFELVLGLPDAQSPRALGQGEDGRLLGLNLKALTIREDAAVAGSEDDARIRCVRPSAGFRLGAVARLRAAMKTCLVPPVRLARRALLGELQTTARASLQRVERVDQRLETLERAQEVLREALAASVETARLQQVELERLRRGASKSAANQAELRRAVERLGTRLSAEKREHRAALAGALEEVRERLNRNDAALSSFRPDLEALLVSTHQKEALLVSMHQKIDATAALAEMSARRHTVVIDEGAQACRTPNGYVLVDPLEIELLVALSDRGDWEPGLRSFCERFVQPGMTVVDGGANVGVHTLTLARRVGPRGRVHAFEPSPKIFKLLRRTVQLNGLTEVVSLHEAALWREHARLPLNVAAVSGHSSVYPLDAAVAQVEVESAPLDALLDRGPVELIKLDVEGAEIDALRGMSRTIASSPDLVIVAEFGPAHLDRTGVSVPDWFGAFASHGFDQSYRLGDETSDLVPFDASGGEVASSQNLLFVRSGSGAASRVEALAA